MNKAFTVFMVGLLALMFLVGVTFISYNNSFAKMEEEVKGRWAQVENQLKRRADLIPNLVETTKGFATQEKDVFGSIAAARSKLLSAGTVQGKIEANAELSHGLNRLLMVAESYPQLKSNETFTRLMDELAGTENRIAVERGRYNESVQAYNTSLRGIPGGMIARVMGYDPATYFAVSEADKAAPKVSFK